MAKHSPTAPRPWETRRFGECAFPVIIRGKTYSCCAPVRLGRPYCKNHCKVMYVPRTEVFRYGV